MTNFRLLAGMAPCFGFIFLFCTIISTYIFSSGYSRIWFPVALVFGFLGGFLVGISVDIYYFPSGFLTGIFLGILIDLSVVGGSWISRHFRKKDQLRLHKAKDKNKLE